MTIHRKVDELGLVLGTVTVALLGGIVIAALAGVLDHVSLLNKPAAVATEVAGGGLLVASWLRRERRWWRRLLPILLLSVAVLIGLIALLLNVTGTVTDPYPPSFAVWVFAAFASIAVAPFVVRRRGEPLRWRSLAALAAIPLTLAGGFMLIVEQYGIWPTVGDVVGHAGVIDGNQAQAIVTPSVSTARRATPRPT